MNKFNDAQRDLLISCMEDNPKLAKTSLDNSFTKETANKKWAELANRLNSLGGANKTVKQWKRPYSVKFNVCLNLCKKGPKENSFIWHASRLRDRMNNLYQQGSRNTWLIGDSGYGLEPILMKPFDNAPEGSPEYRFNRSIRRARASVECTIGLLKNRFRCLLRERTLHYYPPVAAKIIHCCAALHNICLRNNVHYSPPELMQSIEKRLRTFKLSSIQNK